MSINVSKPMIFILILENLQLFHSMNFQKSSFLFKIHWDLILSYPALATSKIKNNANIRIGIWV